MVGIGKTLIVALYIFPQFYHIVSARSTVVKPEQNLLLYRKKWGKYFPKIESIKTAKFTKIEHNSTAQKKNETSFLEKRYFSLKMGEKLC